jgi:hypothetical protein
MKLLEVIEGLRSHKECQGFSLHFTPRGVLAYYDTQAGYYIVYAEGDLPFDLLDSVEPKDILFERSGKEGLRKYGFDKFVRACKRFRKKGTPWDYFQKAGVR